LRIRCHPAAGRGDGTGRVVVKSNLGNGQRFSEAGAVFARLFGDPWNLSIRSEIGRRMPVWRPM
jgi:hypothetical protein